MYLKINIAMWSVLCAPLETEATPSYPGAAFFFCQHVERGNANINRINKSERGYLRFDASDQFYYLRGDGLDDVSTIVFLQ